jgi:hypothetical protein
MMIITLGNMSVVDPRWALLREPNSPALEPGFLLQNDDKNNSDLDTNYHNFKQVRFNAFIEMIQIF